MVLQVSNLVEEECHPIQIWVCSDSGVIRKRKRFNTCRRLIACCKDCPYLEMCAFVCSKLEELLEKERESEVDKMIEEGPGADLSDEK